MRIRIRLLLVGGLGLVFVVSRKVRFLYVSQRLCYLSSVVSLFEYFLDLL